MLNETCIAGQSNSSASTNFLALTKWGTWKMRLYTRVAGSGQAGTKRKGWHIRCCRACQSPVFQAYWALGSEDLSGSKIYLCIKTPTAPTVLTTLPPSLPTTFSSLSQPAVLTNSGADSLPNSQLAERQGNSACHHTNSQATVTEPEPCSLYLDTLSSL